MFNVDDDFLTSVGYDVATLNDDKKAAYKAEIAEELHQRVTEELAAQLDETQVEDLEGIQNSAERAKQWLEEFHSDYASSDEYKAALDAVGEQDALTFYAGALWLRHATPEYGKLAEEIMAAYQAELAEKRRIANEAFGV